MFIHFSERPSVSGGGAERERETQNPKLLQALSCQIPGLEPTKHKIMT